ncbi:uncharacterized protein LOC143300617 [Babylonia areolata]|uniref:uncharacterized protein LOC143300617 n=1 Tax=Babylonia areolata TaxID=304850 RepID=UPI003FD0531B
MDPFESSSLPQHHSHGRHSNDGVYMFLRFPTNNGTTVGVVQQAVVLAQRAVTNLRGRFVGIARKTWDLTPSKWKDEAVVVFWFRTTDNARTFFVSDMRMKQPDFPAPAGLCDAWAVVRAYIPSDELDLNTFMLSEAQLKRHTHYEDYKEKFASRFASLLLDYRAQPFVVQSVGAEMLRRYHVSRDTLVTVHLFRDPAHLAQIKRDPRWHDIITLQREMADDNCSVFTIDTRACP